MIQDHEQCTPIGYVRSQATRRYDAPRQGVLPSAVPAILRLERGRNFEQALEGLAGFERVWLLYLFHLNEHWKPKVHVPRGPAEKIGVFATRAPYRPNPIGLSCVRLDDVRGLDLHLGECDLLDGTPDLRSGALAYAGAAATLTATGQRGKLVIMQGHDYDLDREIDDVEQIRVPQPRVSRAVHGAIKARYVTLGVAFAVFAAGLWGFGQVKQGYRPEDVEDRTKIPAAQIYEVAKVWAEASIKGKQRQWLSGHR